MRRGIWMVGFVLALMPSVPTHAEITNGVMGVTGAEMGWWAGLVLKGIARRSDVQKDSVILKADDGAIKGKSYQPGTITFRAASGESIDIEKMHESIKGVRSWGSTRSEVKYLEITATGEASINGKETLFKVAGTDQVFLLAELVQQDKTPYQRLHEAVSQGKKVTKVTGRIDGWDGKWGKVIKEVPGEMIMTPDKPPIRRMKLFVTAFETGKE